MKVRYWKWTEGEQVFRVYRHNGDYFQVWKMSQWQGSDYYERALQDPDFTEIGKSEADVLIRVVGVNN